MAPNAPSAAPIPEAAVDDKVVPAAHGAAWNELLNGRIDPRAYSPPMAGAGSESGTAQSSRNSTTQRRRRGGDEIDRQA